MVGDKDLRVGLEGVRGTIGIFAVFNITKQYIISILLTKINIFYLIFIFVILSMFIQPQSF
jgi:hypothetical protein